MTVQPDADPGGGRGLNRFLGDLAKCPGVTAHVSVKTLQGGCDWRVGHKAPENRFQVEVNLNPDRVDIEELYVPEFRSAMPPR